MAIAGLALSLFVLSHAAGNMLLFVGPEAYNKYGHAITSNPAIYIAEAGLMAMFVGHIFYGVFLTLRNRGARETGYAVKAAGQKATTLTTKTMWIQGLVILLFVALHLWTFKFGPHYEVAYEDKTIRDLFQLVFEVFQSPVYVAWYVVSVGLLSFHLAHGVQSAIQTLGAHHPRYTARAKKISCVYGLAVGGMFALQPLYMMFIYKG